MDGKGGFNRLSYQMITVRLGGLGDMGKSSSRLDALAVCAIGGQTPFP
jgi:hypothetical protein